MADFPYTSNITNLKKFFTHVQEAKAPDKVTTKYLEAVGFRSKNDRPIIPILKFLGFIDSAGAPTDPWRQYRNKGQSGAVLATAIRGAYEDLFGIYPNAESKDNEALRNFFSSKTNVGSGALGYIVSTFKGLCELGDFSDEASDSSVESSIETQPKIPLTGKGVAARANGLTINLNVELQLPATDDASIYDKLFEAMKKHLLS